MSHSALAETSSDGKFRRVDSGFREIVSSSHPVYTPDANRYHLYISLACPWANRCYAFMKIKGLENLIGLSIVHPTWQRTRPDSKDTHCGWVFRSASDSPVTPPSGHGSIPCDGCVPDSVNNSQTVRQLYDASKDTIGKFSVPVLWDKKTKTIVNNESTEIMSMLNSAFNHLLSEEKVAINLYPEELKAVMDEAYAFVYPNINNGVYRCGFAKTQSAYDQAITDLTTSMERVEKLLSQQRYLCGATLTALDIMLFMTLVRFDEVYVVYFKTNVKRVTDFPNMREYMRELYQMDGIGDSVNMDHIKRHYFTSHPSLNAYAIIPRGPNAVADFKQPHNRARLSA